MIIAVKHEADTPAHGMAQYRYPGRIDFYPTEQMVAFDTLIRMFPDQAGHFKRLL